MVISLGPAQDKVSGRRIQFLIPLGILGVCPMQHKRLVNDS